MANKKLIWIIGIILFIGIAYAGLRTPETDWYEVEEWEKEVCSKWAGNLAPENAETESGYFSYGTSSMTIQAFKTDLENETLYEVYFYLEPYDSDQQYTLQLVDDIRQIRKDISSGTIGVNAGVADYYTEYTDENYNKVRLVHKHGAFSVPIVVKT